VTVRFAGLRGLITGGASGIGLATALALRDEGASIAILDLVAAPTDSGLATVIADVTDAQSVDAAVNLAAETLGGLDILVNNAGVGAQGTVEQNPDEEWHRVLDVNVVGMARVTRAALPYLRRSEHAAIVNTCSIAAVMGLPNRVLYSASKGAVAALTRALAADHLADGIRVNCVVPGTADTPWVARLLADADDPAIERAALEQRQPHGRLVTAGEIADAIVYLASPSSGSTTGAELAVDGGFTGVRVPPRTAPTPPPGADRGPQ
jgi:2-keto-3-deoxy-L-fuconate dehydrogenase